MMNAGFSARAIGRAGRRSRNSSRGAQLLEFAFALPILLLLVVGVWDFGYNFALKQKLTNAAHEAARITVSTPFSNPSSANSCTSQLPCAIIAAATATKQYLNNAGLDSSWINPSSPTSEPAGACAGPSNSTWSWKYTTGKGSTSQTYELDIDASVGISPTGSIDASGYTPGVDSVYASQITLTWPITWKLKGILPSSVLGSQESTTVTMANIGGGCKL